MKKKEKNILIPIMGVIVFIVCIGVFWVFRNSNSSGENLSIWKQINSYRGYVCEISKEEYEFYEYFVRRDVAKETGEEEIETQIKEYAARVHAVFYLGSQLGFCEPYSFEELQLRKEQENASRQEKLAAGEVVYGLKEFTLQTYFQYTLDNLQIELMSYLEEHADEEVLKMAENYYEEHKEEFRYREKIVCEQTIGAKTETLSIDADLLSHMGKADPALGDFLGLAEIGEVYQDVYEGQERTVCLKDIIYNKEGYEHNAEMVLYQFVRNELYDLVIATVAQNNPVEFE